MHVCLTAHVMGQFVSVDALLPLCGSQGLNSGWVATSFCHLEAGPSVGCQGEIASVLNSHRSSAFMGCAATASYSRLTGPFCLSFIEPLREREWRRLILQDLMSYTGLLLPVLLWYLWPSDLVFDDAQSPEGGTPM